MGMKLFRKKSKKESADEKKPPVREVHFEQESEPTDTKGRNTELGIVTYAFILLFIAMIGYLVYLNVWKADSLNSSSYNTKQDANEDKYVRGSIYSSDGQTLAYTSVAEDGTETRVYPYGNVFSHVVGYSTVGKSGLESTSNSDLMTSHTSVLTQLREESDEKQLGDSVYTTLNTTLQQAAYSALGSYNGAVIAMEPDTGKILAMVSKPDFDPNSISEIWEQVVNDSTSSVLLNRATQGLYPPGSTFKILTALAYIRENPTTYSDFSFDCEGTLEESGASIHCYNYKVHGTVDLKTAFAKSCNTTFASIGLNLEKNSLASVCEEFLLGDELTLPTSLQHSASKFDLSSDASYGEIMQTAIGQGNTEVTPLHMAMITATVANDGVMMRPYLVDYVEANDGTLVSSNSPSKYKRLMTTEEASILQEFMEETVISGTATALSWYDFTVAGKTGSAEYGSDENGGTHSWFVGYSSGSSGEADLVVVVIAEDGGAGSDTAVPIASQVFQAYYNLKLK
ncbi:MAG: penicillin-binding protein 2 [Lachnospiraceae bacterium]|nr:penicillin-binding protein 2 [Lachnospiraceae bacterium]